MKRKIFTFKQATPTYKGPGVRHGAFYQDSSLHREPAWSEAHSVRGSSSVYQSSLTKLYYDSQHKKYTGEKENKRGLFLSAGLFLCITLMLLYFFW